MARDTFEVRVRENGTKKSRFYRARSPRDAARCYKGGGFIMWVNRVSQERRLGVGEFFRLGDELMREIRMEEQKKMSEARENIRKQAQQIQDV